MTLTINLCDQRKQLLRQDGHLLVIGGPGSGKTTIALLKSKTEIERKRIQKGQHILFLSFARATVSRVHEHATSLISKEDASVLEINTYHGFALSIIQSFGYLLVPQRKIRLLTPHEASSVLSGLDSIGRYSKCKELLYKEGILSFDLFAETANEVLRRSEKIRFLISDSYPIIYVDEFQDTNSEEWELIKLLGHKSIIVALADQEQRIYDFRGSSPKRIDEFIEHFHPSVFDFGQENNRSGTTDIAMYGNDLLKGLNKSKEYKDVKIVRYRYDIETKFQLKVAIFDSIKRLNTVKPNNDWSIAILVPTKKLTLEVSNYLSKPTRLKEISHEVLVDPSGPALSAVLIANLLEPVDDSKTKLVQLVADLVSHIRGRSGDRIGQADADLSNSLIEFNSTYKIRGPKKQKLIEELQLIIENRTSITLKGIPEEDWITIRKLLQDCTHEKIKNVYTDAMYIRLLNKGALLSEKLTESWRRTGSYLGGSNVIKEALLQEHFIAAQRKWNGVYVMTIHKSKGKEFDEVIIWEEQYQSIIYDATKLSELEKSKYTLRVGITRARSKTTILTPANKPCILL